MWRTGGNCREPPLSLEARSVRRAPATQGGAGRSEAENGPKAWGRRSAEPKAELEAGSASLG
jgi:hypothetical protein